MSKHAFICDAVRTPFGKFAGTLSSIRADDLGALPIKELMARHPRLDWSELDEVVYGCANQAGEDNRNVARMSLLLAGLPVTVPGTTVNRLCGSGLDALSIAARAIASGEANLLIAGGVESMTRAPFVMAKPDKAFPRQADLEDTTIGWRLVNRLMDEMHGTHSMPATAENVARQFGVSRADQDAFAQRSQLRYANALTAGVFDDELFPVTVKSGRTETTVFDRDEHPRPDTGLEVLAKLKPIVDAEGTVTAGNASGVNDGACALLVASEKAVIDYGLQPLARIVASATAGVEPRIMGMGPVPATRKLLDLTGKSVADLDIIELNEAFAAQGLACLRELGIPDDADWVNPNGGAIAIGHPLGASGARLATTAAYQLRRTGGKYALCTMCIGVGQGIAMVLERT